MPSTLAGRADIQATAPTRLSALVVVLAFSGIVVSLMQTTVIPLVPRLPTLLNASAADTTWAVTATLLAAAVATATCTASAVSCWSASP